MPARSPPASALRLPSTVQPLPAVAPLRRRRTAVIGVEAGPRRAFPMDKDHPCEVWSGCVSAKSPDSWWRSPGPVGWQKDTGFITRFLIHGGWCGCGSRVATFAAIEAHSPTRNAALAIGRTCRCAVVLGNDDGGSTSVVGSKLLSHRCFRLLVCWRRQADRGTSGRTMTVSRADTSLQRPAMRRPNRSWISCPLFASAGRSRSSTRASDHPSWCRCTAFMDRKGSSSHYASRHGFETGRVL